MADGTLSVFNPLTTDGSQVARRPAVADALYLGLTLLMFAATWGLLRLCAYLMESK